MSNEINFIPAVGDIGNLPFKIKTKNAESFRNVIIRAIQFLARSDSTLLDREFDISTASADIMLDPEDFNLKVVDIQKKYGDSYTIRLGTAFKVPS